MKFDELKVGMTLFYIINRSDMGLHKSVFIYFIKSIEPELVKFHFYAIQNSKSIIVKNDHSLVANWNSLHSEANEIALSEMMTSVMTLFS
jgi:hypothetical protein